MAENEIERVEQPADLARVDPDSPAGIMMQLMNNGGGDKFDVEGFGKMLEFQERHEAKQAKKVFASDFAAVQSSIEAVVKAKNNPQTKSKYAGLDDVIEMAKPVYTAEGFSIIYYEGKAEEAGHVRVCADVLHKEGHKETYYYDVPLGGVGIQGKVNMTAIHAKATSVTYGRRYLLCMIWNIPTQDDDGNAAGQKPPTQAPTPSVKEQEVIGQIALKMTSPPHLMVDPAMLYPVLHQRGEGRYPGPSNNVAEVAAWLDNMGMKHIFVPDNRSEAEKTLDFPGDEDSQPDTEADRTAAEKFGVENDRRPPRFYCNECTTEYTEFKKVDQCPICLKFNVVDRQANSDDVPFGEDQ